MKATVTIRGHRGAAAFAVTLTTDAEGHSFYSERPELWQALVERVQTRAALQWMAVASDGPSPLPQTLQGDDDHE